MDRRRSNPSRCCSRGRADLDSLVDWVGPDGAERLRGALVTPNFFDVLGVAAARGRTFTAGEGDAPRAVISDAVWRREFGADPAVIGRARAARRGTADPRRGPVHDRGGATARLPLLVSARDADLSVDALASIRPTRALLYQLVGRLKPDVTAAQAQSELLVAAQTVIKSYGLSPDDEREVMRQGGFLVEPVAAHLSAEVRSGVTLLAAVAALVLLIACVNLGLLLLSRMVDRRGELGLRAALGASRARIVGQLVAECLALSAMGGAIGVAAAGVLMPLIRAAMPPVVPRVDQIAIDPVVMGFAAALMLLTTVAGGLGPALFVSRRDLMRTVRATSASSTGDRAILRSRRAILVLQTAAVAMMLVASGLLLRSFWRLQHVDLGFEASNVMTVDMRLLAPKYRQPGRLAAFQGDLLARVRAVPGVLRAGLTTAVPMRGVDFTWVLGPKDQRPRPANMRSVDPSYFTIMHLPLTSGRYFDSRDTAGSERVAVVSEAYGRALFGDANPVGRTLDDEGEPLRIVGVVADVRYVDPARAAAPALYLPNTQEPVGLICLLIEPRPGTQAEVAAGVRRAVQAIDPEQPVEGLTTIGAIVSQSTADRRFYALTTGVFAGVALLLAVAGVFGVVSRTVAERQREIAIRLALGADSRSLLRLVYSYGLVPAAAGIAAGLVIALAGSRLLQSFLFEIAPTDAATYAAAAALVLAVTAMACYLPARRTLRVPAMTVLKSE